MVETHDCRAGRMSEDVEGEYSDVKRSSDREMDSDGPSFLLHTTFTALRWPPDSTTLPPSASRRHLRAFTLPLEARRLRATRPPPSSTRRREEPEPSPQRTDTTSSPSGSSPSALTTTATREGVRADATASDSWRLRPVSTRCFTAVIAAPPPSTASAVRPPTTLSLTPALLTAPTACLHLLSRLTLQTSPATARTLASSCSSMSAAICRHSGDCSSALTAGTGYDLRSVVAIVDSGSLSAAASDFAKRS
mmetsp:Transcript_1112/g.2487  ORF Transcript_1112/g.2487 Transcript_1112/m.2487 type:complete len:250 (+) Transcript_1112:786-1535(+)